MQPDHAVLADADPFQLTPLALRLTAKEFALLTVETSEHAEFTQRRTFKLGQSPDCSTNRWFVRFPCFAKS
jgi:hypothetical protein